MLRGKKLGCGGWEHAKVDVDEMHCTSGGSSPSATASRPASARRGFACSSHCCPVCARTSSPGYCGSEHLSAAAFEGSMTSHISSVRRRHIGDARRRSCPYSCFHNVNERARTLVPDPAAKENQRERMLVRLLKTNTAPPDTSGADFRDSARTLHSAVYSRGGTRRSRFVRPCTT